MAHAPAAAWIVVCIVVGLLYNATAQSPAVPALELLTMPVSRRAIAIAALATRLAHPSSLIAAAILAVLWRLDIYASQPLPDALTWLAAAATLYLSCWLLGVTVRLISVRTKVHLLMLVLATTALSCLLASDYILNQSSGWSVPMSLVLASLTSVVTVRRIEAALHLDAQSLEQRRASHGDRTLLPVLWKSNLQLQVRLLLRNPRARHTLATSWRLWLVRRFPVGCWLHDRHGNVHCPWSKRPDRCRRRRIHRSLAEASQHLLRWPGGVAQRPSQCGRGRDPSRAYQHNCRIRARSPDGPGSDSAVVDLGAGDRSIRHWGGKLRICAGEHVRDREVRHCRELVQHGRSDSRSAAADERMHRSGSDRTTWAAGRCGGTVSGNHRAAWLDWHRVSSFVDRMRQPRRRTSTTPNM